VKQAIRESGRLEKTEKLIPAAEYLRKSTDYQKYSTENQSIVNHAYAAGRGMEIVRTYSDEGRSGLSLDGRDALKQLIDEVQAGRADFKVILVYDVTRWGRFQDIDESAYHEYICRRAGVSVHYCAEQFENDGSLLAALAKSLKRAMAGEYSRELSVKVFAGQARLIRLGFRQGASPGYGTRRLLVDQTGAPKFVLGRGELKSIQTDRVVLIHGPPEELNIVRWIFLAFVNERKSERSIARTLNEKGVPNGIGRPWTYHRIHGILQNEIYIGNSVWNRTSLKLGTKTVRNDPEKWLRVKCAFDPIIDPSLFESAQTIIRERMRQPSKEEMLEQLRGLLRKHGFLSTKLIRQSAGTPSVTACYKWFGGLRRIYKLIGFAGTRPWVHYSNDELLEMLRRLLKARGHLSEHIIDKSKSVPSSSTYQTRFGNLSNVYRLIGFKADPRSHQGRCVATRALSDEQLLDGVRGVLKKRGHLTCTIINESRGIPSMAAYTRRFGSLLRVYELIGYRQKRASGYKLRRRAKKSSKSTISTVRGKNARKC
jgi:DNA invertase Pin-like site-specific DNA recombinase